MMEDEFEYSKFSTTTATSSSSNWIDESINILNNRNHPRGRRRQVYGKHRSTLHRSLSVPDSASVSVSANRSPIDGKQGNSYNDMSSSSGNHRTSFGRRGSKNLKDGSSSSSSISSDVPKGNAVRRSMSVGYFASDVMMKHGNHRNAVRLLQDEGLNHLSPQHEGADEWLYMENDDDEGDEEIWEKDETDDCRNYCNLTSDDDGEEEEEEEVGGDRNNNVTSSSVSKVHSHRKVAKLIGDTSKGSVQGHRSPNDTKSWYPKTSRDGETFSSLAASIGRGLVASDGGVSVKVKKKKNPTSSTSNAVPLHTWKTNESKIMTPPYTSLSHHSRKRCSISSPVLDAFDLPDILYSDPKSDYRQPHRGSKSNIPVLNASSSPADVFYDSSIENHTDGASVPDNFGRCRSKSRIFSPSTSSSCHISINLNRLPNQKMLKKEVRSHDVSRGDCSNESNHSNSSTTVHTMKDAFTEMQRTRSCHSEDEDDHDDMSSVTNASDNEEDDEGESSSPKNNMIPPPVALIRMSSSCHDSAAWNRNSPDGITPPCPKIPRGALVYLYKSLRKFQKTNYSKKHATASFLSHQSITIFLPKNWTNNEKMQLVEYAVGTLNFRLLSVGGSMGEFLQTGMNRCTELYETIKIQLVDKNHLHGKKKESSSMDFQERGAHLSSSNDGNDSPVGMDISVVKPARGFVEELRLAEQIQGLNISNSGFAKPADLETDEVDRGEKNDENDNLEPLERIYNDCSFDIQRRQSSNARRESENSAHYADSGIDYFMHHHMNEVKRKSDRKSSRCFTYDYRSTPLSCSHSPIPRAHIPSNLMLGSIQKCNDRQMSIAETPVPKFREPWGARPVPGRDWMTSEGCSKKTIQKYIELFQKYGTDEDSEVGIGVDGLRRDSYLSPPCSASLFMSAAIAGTAMSGCSLGIEEEEAVEDDRLLEKQELHKEPSDRGLSAIRSENEFKLQRKQRASMAKHKRMSLCAASVSARGSLTATSVAALPFQIRQQYADPLLSVLSEEKYLLQVFGYFTEVELLCKISVVSTYWFEVAAKAQAALMLISVDCPLSLMQSNEDNDDAASTFSVELGDENSISKSVVNRNSEEYDSIAKSMAWNWQKLTDVFSNGKFLSEGAFKRVYALHNNQTQMEEAVSVMDVDEIEATGNKTVVGTELAVSALLSSLVRRNICPNFVLTRRVFTCIYEPPASAWGSASNKKPTIKKQRPKPKKSTQGSFQYMRMELCQHGDAEDFISRQSEKVVSFVEARCLLFQMAFSLHVAGDKFGLKHYDVKLLNFFLQDANAHSQNVRPNSEYTVLRYGLGDHVYLLRMPNTRAIIAKLADYGTATFDVNSLSKIQDQHLSEVTIGQFTTIENTPPEQFILGDSAVQGHGHDNFGLGLAMLHLFTGQGPYEELLEGVVCPPMLRKRLETVWYSGEGSTGENQKAKARSSCDCNYSVLRSIMTIDSDDGDDEAYDVPYDTVYRFLVLFGIPNERYGIIKKNGRFGGSKKFWDAIDSSLLPQSSSRITEENENKENIGYRRACRSRNVSRQAKAELDNCKKRCNDSIQFEEDKSNYSIDFGRNEHISRAREGLKSMKGGMQLLKSLTNFNPDKRLTALGVLNSTFMEELRESSGRVRVDDERDIVKSYMSYALSSYK